jgi:hypothetical protein
MLYKENNAIFESYLNKKVMFLSEEEQQKEQIKSQVTQTLSNPQTQQALEKSADQILAKYSDQIQQVKQQGPEAVAKLLQQLEAELKGSSEPQQGASQQVQEGIWNQAVSNVTGMKRALGNKDDSKTNALNKRFEIFQNEIGKDLRELKMDLGHSSVADNTVKQQVDQMISTLGSGAGGAAVVTPAADTKWSKFRNSAGHLVTGAIPGMAIAAAASPFIGAFGLGALGTIGVKAATSASTAALLSIINDKVNGRPVNWSDATKKAAIAGVGSTLIGAVGNYFHGLGAQAPAGGGGSTPVVPGVASIGPTGDEFTNLHGSGANAISSLDSAKQALADLLRDKGASGVSKGMTGVASPHIMNAIDAIGKDTETYKNIIANLQNVTPENMQNLAKLPYKQLVGILAKAAGK